MYTDTSAQPSLQGFHPTSHISLIHSSIHLHPAINLSATPPVPKMCKLQPSAYLFTFPSTHTFTHLSPRHQSFPLKHLCPLPIPPGPSAISLKARRGKHPWRKLFPTLKRISVVMVKPWVMMGSSSGGRPFQQSSSTQRQPARSVWRYISGEDVPENCPAAGERLSISYSHGTAPAQKGATRISARLQQVSVAG